jgi:nucleoid-associated protein YgaU
MKTSLWMVMAAVSCLAGAGCVAPYGESRMSQAASEREDILLLRETLRRVEGRVEGLEMQADNLRGEWEDSQSYQANSTEDRFEALRQVIESLDQRISELESARQRDREEILDKVAETVARVVKPASTAGRRGTSRAPASGYGYEHTVASGETLSAIAKAYGVTSATIIEANSIENPDRLQVGQVLFIPE